VFIKTLHSKLSLVLLLSLCGCTGTAVEDAVLATCGDGVQTVLELCDDGNTTNGDGCNAACRLEAGFVCNLDNAETCEPCQRMCTGRNCGSDGCGDVCGVCADGASCSEAGQCSLPSDASDAADASDATDPTDDSDASDEGDVSDATDAADAADPSDTNAMCAAGCENGQVGDGTCQPACYVESCQFDTGDGEFSDCACEDVELTTDCSGVCFGGEYRTYPTDNFCDDGVQSWLNFMCEEWSFDGGACDEDFLNPNDPINITCESQGFEYTDCAGTCFNDADCIDNGGVACMQWIGDGQYCDDGSYGVDFNCEAWEFDGGDCGG